jgi:hypothetical protein
LIKPFLGLAKHFLNLELLKTLFLNTATLPGMWERTVTIGSAGKVFSSTGIKVNEPTDGVEDFADRKKIIKYIYLDRLDDWT